MENNQNNEKPKYTNTRPAPPAKGTVMLAIGAAIMLYAFTQVTMITLGVAMLLVGLYCGLAAVVLAIHRLTWVYEQYKHVQFLKPPQQ